MLIGVADAKKGNEVVGVADWKSLLENIPNLRRRLVAKGVGYLRAGPVPKDGICWAAAFPNLTKNAVCARQMRTLDFVRKRALGAVRRVLALKGMRYLGRPSSYYGYLQKLERPAQGRRRVVKLPYSEL